MLLFFLLASDVFIHYRLRVAAPPRHRTAVASMNEIALLIAATLAAGTPLVFAALGELVTEKSGVLNLGVEGMMLVGAVVAFAAASHSGTPWLGFRRRAPAPG